MSKQYRPAISAGLCFCYLIDYTAFVPRVDRGIETAYIVREVVERPGALRRTVLVACPGLARLPRPTSHRRAATYYLYMKSTPEDPRASEPVGIVISRGSRAEPAPIFHAFVWASAPELTPVPKDTKAA